MKYTGLQTQVWKNNTRSILLLLAFPLLVLTLTWIFFFIIYNGHPEGWEVVFERFLYTAPWVSGAVGLWFLFAWFSHTRLIARATGAKPLERRENKRVYNLVENLCISKGMRTPKIQIIEEDALNAYASGISEKTYTITLTRGIIHKLNDKELEGVIAHELMHIRNRDVRLLIISIVFVGIFAFVAEVALRAMFYRRIGGSRKSGDGRIMLLIFALSAIGFLLSLLFRFALSRKREYLADAGAAEMTRNPQALATALRKIAKNPNIEAAKNHDVAQLFIEHPPEKKKGLQSLISGLFATHPPIENRIKLLEQF